MDVVLADPLVVALILGAAGMPATGARVCKRWREALEYPEAWIHLDVRLRDKGLYAACSAGDLKFVQHRVSCLLTNGMPWIAEVMLKAASSQRPANLELVAWIVQKFNICAFDARAAMRTACGYGVLPTAQWFVEHYGIAHPDWFALGPHCLKSACEGARLDVAKWLTTTFKISASVVLADNERMFLNACIFGHLDLAKWMATEFELSREDVYLDWASPLYYSIKLGQRDVAMWLISRYGVTEVNLSWFSKHNGDIKATAGGLWLVKQLGLNCRTSAYAICAHVRQIVALD
jgi:hypothetical protein